MDHWRNGSMRVMAGVRIYAEYLLDINCDRLNAIENLIDLLR